MIMVKTKTKTEGVKLDHDTEHHLTTLEQNELTAKSKKDMVSTETWGNQLEFVFACLGFSVGE